VKDKNTILEQIKADIVKNNICPNLAREAKNLVMGDGNLNAEIVFIGEAPGKNEDE
jgi:DNA polymerase